jgi:hypothetical protein
MLEINDEECRNLTPMEKGYLDELGFTLKLMLYPFVGKDNLILNNNYSSLSEYAKSMGKGVDYKLKIGGKTIEIEKKFLKAKCYRSWVLRDYLPRFSYSKDTIPVVVVTNKWNISCAGRKLLKEYGIKLFSDYEFFYWLCKYVRKHSTRNKSSLNYSKRDSKTVLNYNGSVNNIGGGNVSNDGFEDDLGMKAKGKGEEVKTDSIDERLVTTPIKTDWLPYFLDVEKKGLNLTYYVS